MGLCEGDTVIHIKIELWPMGDRKRAKILQEGIIHNTGGTDSIGEYEYLFSKQGGFKGDIATIDVKNVLRRGKIEGFPRLRLYAQDLLLRALTIAFGDRANWGKQ